MGHSRNKLTSRAISAFPKGQYGDGGGLLLRKTSPNSGSWVYRYSFNGKQRQIGLGSFNRVSLANARKQRDHFEGLIADGVNPVDYKRERKAASIEGELTLAELTELKFEAHKANLKDGGKAGRWLSPLKLHVLPRLGKRNIVSINQRDVADVLRPLWYSKPPTAIKAARRLDAVFRHAAALGIDVDLQAVVKAKLLLGEQTHREKNLQSMPWRDVPTFYQVLDAGRLSHQCLKFMILNPGPRSTPVRHLRIDDIEDDVWTISDREMKGMLGRTDKFRTPLSTQSLDIIDALLPTSVDGYLFPNVSGKGVISDSTTSKLMRNLNAEGTPHGFRSSFRTWAAETCLREDIAEMCLAHKVHRRVEAAYVRTDYLEQRRELMQAWSNFVTSAQ